MGWILKQTHRPVSFWLTTFAIVLAFLQISSVCCAQGMIETNNKVQQYRVKRGIWIGPAFSMGSFSTSSNEAGVNGRLDGMMSLSIGGDFWESERFGLYGRALIGFGQDLILPNQDTFAGQTINFNQSVLNLGARTRWFFSKRVHSPSVSVNVGMYAGWQLYSDQTPFTFLVNRSSYGPELGVSATLPIKKGSWLRAQIQGGPIFLVREDPVDSGELDQAYQLNMGIDGQIPFSSRIGLSLQVVYRLESYSFLGFGTRNQGIFDAQIDDSELFSALNLVIYF